MIFTVFLALSGFGLGVWLLGYVFDMTGVAAVGAIIVVGAGATVVLGGVEVATGQTEINSYANVSNETVNNKTVIQTEYRQLSTPQQFQTGGLVMLVGGLLFTRGLAKAGGLE